ncbi:hypothetical protein DDZ13_04755 [Coraliomargarita sinensis]|uniref:Uncharacterized protein n=1 Tax=Coraliomargarita sinensis TaxID=2174842 RepID=A0A317ZKZ1_9BACT|nr:DUF4912 domain-containing protein [Coraliomargarita sinensis]PXA04489.1 hypothetical protein DDZ13_04755 [Coraliomargarita sinensis]
MSDNRANFAKLQEKIEKSKAPAIDFGIQLLPVSHNEFQARWSLNKEMLDAGLKVASHDEGDTHLVLRAYSLPAASDSSHFSSVWHDYRIDSTDNSGYFTLPAPAPKINAALGLINRSGRFSPLVRGEAVALPAAPSPEPPKPAAPEAKAEDSAAHEDKAAADFPTDQNALHSVVLNEREIAERLEHITGLPESFKSRNPAITKSRQSNEQNGPGHSTGVASTPPETTWLDEVETLKTVRHNMAINPEPNFSDSRQDTPPAEASSQEQPKPRTGGASEQLASQWEDIWSGNAPVQVRAEYVLTGKIASGMKLMMGNEILQPAPGGFIVWKRTLESFNQIWPLLNAALTSPSVAAGPSLEFFKDVHPSERLLELHAALEIEGKITDPAYASLLPTDLQLDADGTFKLRRMLPDGAVILPGLSLIAG